MERSDSISVDLSEVGDEQLDAEFARREVERRERVARDRRFVEAWRAREVAEREEAARREDEFLGKIRRREARALVAHREAAERAREEARSTVYVKSLPGGYTYRGRGVRKASGAVVPEGPGKLFGRGGQLVYVVWRDGVRHGRGAMLLPEGVWWEGPFSRDRANGLGDVVYPPEPGLEEDGPTRRGAVYRDGLRVCWLEELCPGAVVALRGASVVYAPQCVDTGGRVSGTILAVEAGGARVRLQFPDGSVRWVRLVDEEFHVVREAAVIKPLRYDAWAKGGAGAR